MQTQELLLSLSHLGEKLTTVYAYEQSYQEELQQLERQLEELQSCLTVVTQSRAFYRKAVEKMYQQSVQALERILCSALSYVFEDLNYTVELRISDKRGNKELDVVLLDHTYDPPLEVDIREGGGKGVRSVVSCVMHISYVLGLTDTVPLLLSDEGYSAISSDYIGRFVDFVKGLTKSVGLALVLISHDPRLIPYADKVYSMQDGKLTLEDVCTGSQFAEIRISQMPDQGRG